MRIAVCGIHSDDRVAWNVTTVPHAGMYIFFSASFHRNMLVYLRGGGS